MIHLLHVVALGAAVAGAAPVPDLRPRPLAAPHDGDTRCAACHTAASWKEVRFAHERTGFPLDGRHAQVSCRACHPSGFEGVVSGACAACHRDPHAGGLGNRCAGCHDAASWRSTFGADAHRRTDFPLSGRHAVIPCEECHGDRRDRGFARATVDCLACHQADYARAAAVSIDHDAAGFGTACRGCHGPWRFSQATFPGHDACFLITSGPHARIACGSCHTSVRGLAPTGACSSSTASCTRCHACGDMGTRHRAVLGFRCSDRRCYECHRFASAGAALRSATGRGPSR